jgi:nucleotide-binding universal stress UspA family protein
MDMLKKILAPTDFSDLSVRGVRYACQLAKGVGAEVTILNVVIVDESGIRERWRRTNSGLMSLLLKMSLMSARI